MSSLVATDEAGRGQGADKPDEAGLSAPLAVDSSLLAEGDDRTCPVCRRVDTLLRLGAAVYCAACGYASEGGFGCT